MDIVQSVKNFVELECKKPTSKYGWEPFPFHLVPMVKYAGKLADELGGDKEIILVAAWLHDIGSIIHGRENHHLSGAKIAERKLKELRYPIKKIKSVKKCILNHRCSQESNRRTIEERIIAEADAMANFDNIAGIFKAAYIYENQTQDEAMISTREKLKHKWHQLHFENSRIIIKPKYKAAMLLLR